MGVGLKVWGNLAGAARTGVEYGFIVLAAVHNPLLGAPVLYAITTTCESAS